MLEINSKSIRFLAHMGARGVLGQAVFDLAEMNHDFYVASADLAHASGFDRFVQQYPERFVNVGIAEQNLIGVSAGLAFSGTPVIATTWAMFASARVADQVRNYMGYMQANIKLIGMDSGFMQSRFSYSHTNPPDLAIMRAIPGITILSPCDGVEIYYSIKAALQIEGPVYIRLTGPESLPMVHKDANFQFTIGKSITLLEGHEVAIVATGNIVNNAIEAAYLLQEKGISAKVVDLHTINPLDKEMLDSISKYKLVVSIEEHLKQGGLGSAIAEYYSDRSIRPQHLIIGVNSEYPKTGDYKYLYEKMGLMPEQIVEQIIHYLN